VKRALILIACVVIAVIAAGYFLLDGRSYTLTAASMEPTLHCARPAPLCRASTADRVVALKYVLVSPGRGDLVVFHAPIKARAACGLMPGVILIKRITRIVNGRYFLRGDNAGASCDSRVWGTVPRGNLIGRVVATYWPLGRISVH
jgi:signal peptidase I